MHYLIKLAIAIDQANRIRNAEDFILAANQPRTKSTEKSNPNNPSTSPTKEEQTKHERGVSFGESLDLSVEPSTEYLN